MGWSRRGLHDADDIDGGVETSYPDNRCVHAAEPLLWSVHGFCIVDGLIRSFAGAGGLPGSRVLVTLCSICLTGDKWTFQQLFWSPWPGMRLPVILGHHTCNLHVVWLKRSAVLERQNPQMASCSRHGLIVLALAKPKLFLLTRRSKQHLALCNMVAAWW